MKPAAAKQPSPSHPLKWCVHVQGSDEVFRFLEEVLGEVVGLFPFDYVHIGGDECPKVRWEACPRCQQRMRQVRRHS